MCSIYIKGRVQSAGERLGKRQDEWYVRGGEILVFSGNEKERVRERERVSE